MEFALDSRGAVSARSSRRSPQHGGASLGSTAKPLRGAVLLAPARCTGTKRPFAIRFEQGVRGIWQACAAFAISERQLCNPAFSSDEVRSSASLSPSYPGCPHRGADPRKEFAAVSFVRCSCRKLACSSGIIGIENLSPWSNRAGTLVRHGPLPGRSDEVPLRCRQSKQNFSILPFFGYAREFEKVELVAFRRV